MQGKFEIGVWGSFIIIRYGKRTTESFIPHLHLKKFVSRFVPYHLVELQVTRKPKWTDEDEEVFTKQSAMSKVMFAAGF